MDQVNLSTLGLLAGYELEARLNCELIQIEVIRSELASSEPIGGELVGFQLTEIFLHNAGLGEVLHWDQPE